MDSHWGECSQIAILCGIITETADRYKYLSNVYLFLCSIQGNLTLCWVAVYPLEDRSVFRGTQTKVVRERMTTRKASWECVREFSGSMVCDLIFWFLFPSLKMNSSELY